MFFLFVLTGQNLVDGVAAIVGEHVILKRANECLSNTNLKSLLIEVNENFDDHFNTIIKIMDNFQFYIKSKKQNPIFAGNDKFSKTYNYFFERK